MNKARNSPVGAGNRYGSSLCTLNEIQNKTLWAVMTFPIQYSSTELLLNADIDLALFQTALGWSDTQASVTVERH